MSEKTTGRGSDQFPLRLPDGMREQIRSASEATGRSMNAEIVNRLQASFEPGRLATMLEASLPPAVFQALELGSVINQIPIADRLSQIIAGSLEVDSEYDKLHMLYMEATDQKRELQEQVADLRSQINYEFMGHYSRVVQMNTLLEILVDQHSSDLGPVTGKIVQDMLRLNSQELELLKDRREELSRNEMVYRKRLEISRKNENPDDHNDETQS
ncbi:MAG: Arc family DNA-binding protein [Rhizobium sp.]|nr:Arc family DNA-binding protein [Rhizobium sp.]